MNPLLSFWMKCQPLCGGLTGNGCLLKAISQSTALTPQSPDGEGGTRATVASRAFDYLADMTAASRIYAASASWLLGPLLNPIVSRIRSEQAAAVRCPMLSGQRALCEADKSFPRQEVRLDAAGLRRAATAGAGSKRAPQSLSALQLSQQMLQQEDYLNYQIQPRSVRRRNSKDWTSDYKGERIDKINYNNVFGGTSAAGSENEIPVLPPPPGAGFREVEPLSPAAPSPVPVVSSAASSDASGPSAPAAAARTRRRRAAVPDAVASSSTPELVPSPAVSSVGSMSLTPPAGGPAGADVICGRGGKANTHEGNKMFRDEARRLKDWYESSSKSEKYAVSAFLVDFVKRNGGRFLVRGAGGEWEEADPDDARRKASQALREGRKAGR